MPAVQRSNGSSWAMDAGKEDFFYIGMDADVTLQAPANPSPWKKVIVAVKAVGADRTVTLESGEIRLGSDISALTATISGKTDYLGLLYNPVDRIWDLVSYSKGY